MSYWLPILAAKSFIVEVENVKKKTIFTLHNVKRQNHHRNRCNILKGRQMIGKPDQIIFFQEFQLR